MARCSSATYDNRYEVYGGINFMNFQAGQNLPKRMNLGGAEVLGTYWLTQPARRCRRLPLEGERRRYLPNPNYNRVAGLTKHRPAWARSTAGRRAGSPQSIYHALLGVAHG